MRKALRYLKPYWVSVIAIVLLVVFQVQCNLALPDYMSSIVTNGIQYGGITESVPEKLSRDTYDHMALFLDESGQSVLAQNYEQSDGIYVLKSDADADNVYGTLAQSFLIVKMLGSEEISSQLNMPAGVDVWQALSLQPQMASQIEAKVDEAMEGYTQENLDAAVKVFIKDEYQLVGVDTDELQSAYIRGIGGKMMLVALFGSLAAILSSYLASRTATGAGRDMRRDVFAKVESFSSEEYANFSTASLITRTTNDIQQVQMVLTMLLRIVLFAPTMGVMALIKVPQYRELSGILFWAVAILIAGMGITFGVTLPKFRQAQKLVDELNQVTREQLSGMLVVRAFNNEKREEEAFDQVNKETTDLNIFLNKVMAIVSPLMQFVMSVVSILIIWYGANMVDAGSMQIGSMMAFLQYATEVLISFMIVAAIFIMIPRSSVSANRVFAVLETEAKIEDPKEPKELPEGNAEIAFDHVYFRYPGAEKEVLEDINFKVEPGETVAFIGSTGSGKSTVINLIPRFFDVTEGKITFGGVDIRDVKQKDLRARIGYVPQKGVLFAGTVESNLRYGNENISEEGMWEALRIAQADDFVKAMPNGLQEPVAQGGSSVSGGQKQRLCIARALCTDAKVYIFDDTFSALDYATDVRLRAELVKLVKREYATVFIVAQRVTSIMHADKIVVLDEGKIVGMGTHNELLKSCEVYQEICSSQLSSQELAEVMA